MSKDQIISVRPEWVPAGAPGRWHRAPEWNAAAVTAMSYICAPGAVPSSTISGGCFQMCTASPFSPYAARRVSRKPPPKNYAKSSIQCLNILPCEYAVYTLTSQLDLAHSVEPGEAGFSVSGFCPDPDDRAYSPASLSPVVPFFFKIKDISQRVSFLWYKLLGTVKRAICPSSSRRCPGGLHSLCGGKHSLEGAGGAQH